MGEFAAELFGELQRRGVLLEAAPEIGTVECLHRWHVLQFVSAIVDRRWFFFASSRPSISWLAAAHVRSKILSLGRRYFSGGRWQAMHHSIWSDGNCDV